jgi:hypothetical protein
MRQKAEASQDPAKIYAGTPVLFCRISKIRQSGTDNKEANQSLSRLYF